MEMINPEILPDCEADSPELKLILHKQSKDFIDKIRNVLLSSNRLFSLHFLASNGNKPMIEFSSFIQGNVTKLHMQYDMSQSYRCFLQNTHDLPSCQFLTYLSLTCSKFHVDDSVFKALSKAVKEGKIPNLSHLSFARLKEDIQSKLYLLFQTPWPKLHHFKIVDQGKLFTEQWTSLTTLDLSNSYSGYFPTLKLTDAVNNGLVPNLTTLKL